MKRKKTTTIRAAAKKPSKSATEHVQAAQAAQPSQLELFLKALSGVYSNDLSEPGLVVSWLEKRQIFYASAVRYTGAFGQGKQIIVQAEGKTLTETVNELAVKWLAVEDRIEKLKQATRRPESHRNWDWDEEDRDI